MLNQAEKGTPEYWVDQMPDAIAVVKGDRTMSYREWNDQANRVADSLERAGLKSGDRLGMRFRLDFHWFIVQRALQKLGVVQVAVNWKLTPQEALYIIKDSGAVGLACDDVDSSQWAELDCGLLVTVGQSEAAQGLRLEDLIVEGDSRPRFGPLALQMVLYTSGTTGAPKGVPPIDRETLDQERLSKYVASVSSVPPLPDNPRVLLTLPVHHGAGPGAARDACAKGGTIVLLDPYDAEEAVRLIDRHKIQVWTAVPTMLLRVQALDRNTIDRYDLSSITAITVGAAAVPYTLKTWILEKFGDVLWEAYGASEAGMLSYISPADQTRKPGSSGKPYDGVQIDIVDDEWNRLPPGETGEIAVNTPMVLKGYLGREPLGEDVVKDGFYRTGDVGHVDEDGYLFITDRIKDMIVAGGVNIYPAEIEKAILQHPAVVDCAVIGVPQDDFGEQALAFIVPARGASPTEDDLKEFLKPLLASFKLPRLYEFVSDLPVNPMGKVLKQELRKPYWAGRERHV